MQHLSNPTEPSALPQSPSVIFHAKDSWLSSIRDEKFDFTRKIANQLAEHVEYWTDTHVKALCHMYGCIKQ